MQIEYCLGSTLRYHIYIYIYIYPPPCPEGTRWSVHNVFKGSLSWCPGVKWGLFKGTPPPPGHALAWLFLVLAAPYFELFFDTSPEPCVSNFWPRSLPKWSPNEPQIRRKLVPTAFQKNIHKTIRIFSIFSLFRKGRCSRNIVKHSTKRCFS